MNQAAARRKILSDYRITATKCTHCGRTYFPPKPLCNVHGRNPGMQSASYFYEKGKLISCSAIRKPSTIFCDCKSFLVGIIQFKDGLKVPGKITDWVIPNGEVDTTEIIGKEVIPRFRKSYEVNKSVNYSSLSFSFADDYYPHQEYKLANGLSKNKNKPGIVGYGVYLPKFRIRNEEETLGVKERTLPFVDEDATTFAVEAGKRALIHSSIANSWIKKCFLGSESTPYAVKPSLATVSQVLELGEKHDGGFYSGGIDAQFACKAASDLFIDAVALIKCPAFGGEYVMVIGTDNSQAAEGDPLDYTVGAGAAAFIFGKRDVIATLDGYASYTSDTPDFYRKDGEKYPEHGGRFTGKPGYFKHVSAAVKKVLEESKLTPKDISWIVTHSPNAKYPLQIALEEGFTKEQVEPGLVVRWTGNLYAASSPAALAAVLDVAKPGDKILLVSYGSGAGSDAYIFTVTEEIEKKRERLITVKEQIENPHKEYVDYATYRKWKG